MLVPMLVPMLVLEVEPVLVLVFVFLVVDC